MNKDIRKIESISKYAEEYFGLYNEDDDWGNRKIFILFCAYCANLVGIKSISFQVNFKHNIKKKEADFILAIYQEFKKLHKKQKDICSIRDVLSFNNQPARTITQQNKLNELTTEGENQIDYQLGKSNSPIRYLVYLYNKYKKEMAAQFDLYKDSIGIVNNIIKIDYQNNTIFTQNKDNVYFDQPLFGHQLNQIHYKYKTISNNFFLIARMLELYLDSLEIC